MYLWQSPFILQKKTQASEPSALGTSWLSIRLNISLQYLLSSPTILLLQALRRPMFLEPFCSSFFSMEESALQAVLRGPMVFLQATERRFLSSTLRVALAAMTLFIASSMSSNLSVCSVILAKQRCSSLVVAVIPDINYQTSTKIFNLTIQIYSLDQLLQRLSRSLYHPPSSLQKRGKHQPLCAYFGPLFKFLISNLLFAIVDHSLQFLG